MNRIELHKLLNTVAKTTPSTVGSGSVTCATLRLKRNMGTNSVNNRLGMFDAWEVICFVPTNHGIEKLDELRERVLEVLDKTGCEITVRYSEDIDEPNFGAWQCYIQFQFPKTIIKRYLEEV